jgi:cell division protein FtsW
VAKRVGVDKVLFCSTLILVVIGLVMVFSASAMTAKAQFGSPYTFLIKQAVWAVLGLAAMTALMQVDYRSYN